MPGFGQWDAGKTLKMRTLKEMSLKARSQAQEIRSLYECRDRPSRRRGQTVSNGGGEGAEDPGADHQHLPGRTSFQTQGFPLISASACYRVEGGSGPGDLAWVTAAPPCRPSSTKGTDQRALWSHNARDPGTLSFLLREQAEAGAARAPGTSRQGWSGRPGASCLSGARAGAAAAPGPEEAGCSSRPMLLAPPGAGRRLESLA